MHWRVLTYLHTGNLTTIMAAAYYVFYHVLLSQTPADYEVTLTGPEDTKAIVYEDVGLPSWAVRWEIIRSNLVVDDKILGRGNFGEVRSGTVDVCGQRTKSAVKILKGRVYWNVEKTKYLFHHYFKYRIYRRTDDGRWRMHWDCMMRFCSVSNHTSLKTGI